MRFQEHQTVVLRRDVPEHGLRKGDLGAVVFVHTADAVEVEFMRASGNTQAVLQLSASDLRLASDGDVLAIRPVDT